MTISIGCRDDYALPFHEPRRHGTRRLFVPVFLRASVTPWFVMSLERSGELRLAHQVLIDGARGAPSLGNRPYDQRLATLHVACGEDPWHIRHPFRIAGDVSSGRQRHIVE